MKYFGIVLSIVLLSALLSSCNDDVVYDEYKSIKNNSWEYSDSVKFEFDIKDTAQHYNLFVNIRHNFYFDWRNIWVKIITVYPNNKVETSSVNLPLSEADGKWYASCSGDICTIRIGIQQNAVFPQTGKYKFIIVQDMRQNPLPKLIDVGLRVEKYQKK